MNKKNGILKYSELLMILIIWIIIFAAPILLFQGDDVITWEIVFIAWKGVFLFFILFLLNHFLLVPFLLFKKRKSLYLLSAITIIIAFSLNTYFIEKSRPKRGLPQRDFIQPPPPERADHISPPERHPGPQQPKTNHIPFPPFVNTIIISFLVVGFDTGLRMLFKWSKLEKEKTELEKEKVQSQLAFLSNQVSPHFFMNTLNNIHALIDIDSEEAKDAIIKLSKLMRYLLYESQAKLVPLAKELDFIKSYVNLMKLRFSERVEINFNVSGELPDKSIPPLLFTSFVENAFKHGISYEKSSFIDIMFSYVQENLKFTIKNSKPEIIKENTSFGIGIENSRKRLDIIYGTKYSLKIEDNDDYFVLNLTIPV
ncbi:MAG: histidine kinase [Bacteroidales bacterium]|nr:histidine kinase [Bacteroidales bacterium]